MTLSAGAVDGGGGHNAENILSTERTETSSAHLTNHFFVEIMKSSWILWSGNATHFMAHVLWVSASEPYLTLCRVRVPIEINHFAVRLFHGKSIDVIHRKNRIDPIEELSCFSLRTFSLSARYSGDIT